MFVVDDDASVRASLKSLLESIGLHVELFESADDFLKSKIPDIACCLVLDVRLPGLSGLEFQAELAKAGLNFPIIFLTGHADIPMTVQAMKAGAVEFLTKPCRDQDLLHAVRTALERDRVRRKDQMHTALLRAQSDSPDNPREGGHGLRRSGTFKQADCRGDGYHRGHSEDASRKHHAENAGAIAGGPGKDGRSSGHQPHEIQSALDLSILYSDYPVGQRRAAMEEMFGRGAQHRQSWDLQYCRTLQ